MLLNLQINNIALIEKIEISFFKGLNVLSGETGAGKSIIIDSLNFVLGGKADRSIIKSGTNKCETKAFFSDLNLDVKNDLTEMGFESADEVLLSRSLTTDGKNECRINGAVVTLTMLKQVASLLMDIHGQHEHQKLLNETFQLEILDTFAGENVAKLKVELAELLSVISKIKSEIKEIGGSDEERANTLDFLKYQITEIENAKLKDNEDEKLAEEKTKLLNSGKIYEAISGAFNIFSGENSDSGIIEKVSTAKAFLNSIADFDENFKSIYDRLDTVFIELEDLETELDNLNQAETFSETKLDEIENRLNLIKNLKRKYGATFSEIYEYQNEAKLKLEKIENSAELLVKLNNKLNSEKEKALSVADKLTKERNLKALEFEKLIEKELESLGMSKAKFVVAFVKNAALDLNKNGLDKIVFLFSANVGIEAKELTKVISGGEMSRVSLAIKNIISAKDSIDAMVFDEVDTGISGKMGQVVAEKMANISKYKQVIVVSHLPQIVAMADVNFLIEKFVEDEKTKSAVKVIYDQQQIAEIARLVGGNDNSSLALMHAAELKSAANAYKNSLN